MNTIVTKATQTLDIDLYVLDSLMADLVGHDRRPSAYILYLALVRLCAPAGVAGISPQGLARATGLSKTAVQRSVAHLARRGLIESEPMGRTQAPRYRVRRPWRR